MRKIEKLSLLREEARRLYEVFCLSNREIERKLRVSEKSVRNWAEKGGWKRNSAPAPQPNPQSEATEQGLTSIGKAAARIIASDVDRLVGAEAPRRGPLPEPRTATEIAREFCGTMDVLRAEIDTVVRNLHLIRDLAESDSDTTRRRLLNKVLELPGLVKASNDLTAALSRLTEADPGKKEQAKSNARQVGAEGRFATPAAPGTRTTAH